MIRKKIRWAIKCSFTAGLLLVIFGISSFFSLQLKLIIEILGWLFIYISFDILMDEVDNMENLMDLMDKIDNIEMGDEK
ncbi:MAG: hypothetical protein ACP5L4_02000 [Thermoplasmata archaeon]